MRRHDLAHVRGHLLLRHLALAERFELDEDVRVIHALEDGGHDVRDARHLQELRCQREHRLLRPRE
jgi:hypothetical protein